MVVSGSFVLIVAMRAAAVWKIKDRLTLEFGTHPSGKYRGSRHRKLTISSDVFASKQREISHNIYESSTSTCDYVDMGLFIVCIA